MLPEIPKSDQSTQSPSKIYNENFVPGEPRRAVYDNLHAKAAEVKAQIYNDRMRWLEEYEIKLIDLSKSLLKTRSEREIKDYRSAPSIETRVNNIIFPKIGKREPIDMVIKEVQFKKI